MRKFGFVVLAVLMVCSFSLSVDVFSGRGDSDRDYVSYVELSDVGGRVVDEESGELVEDVNIWGEVHSYRVYFKIDIDRENYSFWIDNSPDFESPLLDSGEGKLTNGCFVLPISKYLENENHFIQFSASAEGYETYHYEGHYESGEEPFFNIELEKITGPYFTLSRAGNPPENNSIEIERTLETRECRAMRINKWEEDEWVEWSSSKGEDKRRDIEENGFEPLKKSKKTWEWTETSSSVVTEEESDLKGGEDTKYKKIGTETRYVVDVWRYRSGENTSKWFENRSEAEKMNRYGDLDTNTETKYVYRQYNEEEVTEYKIEWTTTKEVPDWDYKYKVVPPRGEPYTKIFDKKQTSTRHVKFYLLEKIDDGEKTVTETHSDWFDSREAHEGEVIDSRDRDKWVPTDYTVEIDSYRGEYYYPGPGDSSRDLKVKYVFEEEKQYTEYRAKWTRHECWFPSKSFLEEKSSAEVAKKGEWYRFRWRVENGYDYFYEYTVSSPYGEYEGHTTLEEYHGENFANDTTKATIHYTLSDTIRDKSDDKYESEWTQDEDYPKGEKVETVNGFKIRWRTGGPDWHEVQRGLRIEPGEYETHKNPPENPEVDKDFYYEKNGEQKTPKWKEYTRRPTMDNYLAGYRWRETVENEFWTSENKTLTYVLKSENDFSGTIELGAHTDSPHALTELEKSSINLSEGGEERVDLTISVADTENLHPDNYELSIRAVGEGHQDTEDQQLEIKKKIEPPRVEKLALENPDRIYESYFGDDTAKAYYSNNSPIVKVTSSRSKIPLKSNVLLKGPEDRTMESAKTGEGKVFRHRNFDPPSKIGKWSVEETFSHGKNSDISDFKKDVFYAVFGQNGTAKDWRSEDTMTGNPETYWDVVHIPYLQGDIHVDLHPKSLEILEFTSSTCSSADSRTEAAERLANEIKEEIDYSGDHNDYDDVFKILDINGESPTGEARGWCVDFTAAYIACARALGIPARQITMGGKSDNKKSGHAFAEVYMDGEWTHVEPQAGAVGRPGRYVDKWGNVWRDIEVSVEPEPGENPEPYPYITLKYSVFPETESVSVNVDEDGSGTAEIEFANYAGSREDWWDPWDREKYVAKDFSAEVIDSEGLDLSLTQLSEGKTLEPGEIDNATLEVEGAEPDYYDIVLNLSYTTDKGESISKNSTLEVRVK